MRAAVVGICIAAALRLERGAQFGLQWDGVTRTNLPSLKVGRFDGEQDVVAEGLVTEQFKTGTLEIPALSFKQHFYVEAEASSSGPVEVTAVSVTTGSAAVTATASLEGALPGKADIWVDFTCTEAGVADVSITLELAAPFLSPTWVVKKRCRADDHVGLQVGTQPGGADVVAAGAAAWASTHVVAYSLFVLPLFASLGQGPNVLLNPVRMTVTPVTSPEVALAARRNETQRRAHGRWGSAAPTPTREGIALLDALGGEAVLTHGKGKRVNGTLATARRAAVRSDGVVEMSGDLTEGGLLEPGGEAPALLLTFKCPHPGSWSVELELEPFPAYQPYHPVPVSFVKVCGGSERAGFHVGAAEGGQELIKDGVVTGDHKTLDNVADSSAIWITYDPLSPMDVDQAPELTIACAGPENEEIVKLTVQPSPDHVAIDYECLMPGIALCSVVFQFKMWKAPEALKWSKECGGVRKDIVITSALEEFPTAFANGALDPGWKVRLKWEEDSLQLAATAKVPVHAKFAMKSLTGLDSVAVSPRAAELGPDPTPLLLNVSCGNAAAGAYAVELVVTMPGYETIHVPFEKECQEPEFVQFTDAPGGLLGLVAIIALLVAIPVSLIAFCVMRGLRSG